ncbi:hypothetical protein N8559_09630, partial [Gammaproteobacteria bacterium]|nr:hypothetical protein [Gammaproteobacteria bacterium]
TAGAGIDNLSGGAGIDTFIMAGNFTFEDTISGGDGVDIMTVSAGIASSGVMQNVTGVETLTVTGANTLSFATAITDVITIDFSEAADQVLNLNTGFSGAVEVVLTGDTTNADSVINTAGVALTVTAGVLDLDSATTITGGAGTDIINLTATAAYAADAAAVTLVETINILAGGAGADGSLDLGAYGTALTVSGATLISGEDLDVDGSSATAALTLVGGAGQNTLSGGTGNDTLTGGSAADTLEAGNGTNLVNGGGGNDTITGGTGADTINGEDGADTIDGINGANSISGGAGNDTITGGAGADTISGGDGADAILSETGLDILTGGAGNDTFTIVANTSQFIYSSIQDAANGDILTFANQGTEVDNGQVTLGSNATFSDYIDTAVAGDGSTNGVFSWFTFGSNTYVVQDKSAAATYVASADIVVELVGVLDLTSSTGRTTNAITLDVDG